MKQNLVGLVLACCLPVLPIAAQDFHFDGSISRPVLENYLSRSISFTELFYDDLISSTNNRGVDPHDNLRLILGTKAKFIGRALMVWGREKNLSAFLVIVKSYVAVLYWVDLDIVFQTTTFKIV